MSKQKILGIVLVAGIIAAVAFYISGQPVAQTAMETENSVAEEHGATGLVDLEAAMAERSLGDESAPVTIEEFASLSCSHCAHFTNDTFGRIEEDYIKTGKVRFIFTDFPLNAPAMDAAMIARCLPRERYFKFIKFLFKEQESWAFDENYQKKLRQNAKLLGATDELLDACLESEELKTALVERMQKAAADHEIKSTPSFVVNGGELVRGAQNFDAFQKIINKKLEGSKVTE